MKIYNLISKLLILIVGFGTMCKSPTQPVADLIIKNAKILTVDSGFTIANGLAIKGNKFIAVGSADDILKFKGVKTQIVDVMGRTVIPGLIDAHTHPESASLSEVVEEIPDLHSIQDLLNWIQIQATNKKEREWIIHPKLFYTRLGDLRQPTLEELDQAAPDNPVFLNGSYGGLINSEAMKISGITKESQHEGLIRNPKTNQLTGFIRGSAFDLLNLPVDRNISPQKEIDALKALFSRYNQYGITGIISGYADLENYKRYREMSQNDELTLRITQNFLLPTTSNDSSVESLTAAISAIPTSTGEGNEWVRTGSMKIFLDGGILTGTAYLREPWGVRSMPIYNISDPDYRGVVKYSFEQLTKIISVVDKSGWVFTAHCTGGGAVDLLLDVFEDINAKIPIREKRFSIIHGNFFDDNAIKRMQGLGVLANIQPAWFYKDADAMNYILGIERIKTFNPYNTMIKEGVILCGGSDHMVKLDANTSINPYNPFIGMWTMITRTTDSGKIIEPDEAITRRQALEIYTINNAFATSEEALKGSIEVGKLADLAVLSEDLLECPVNRIKDIQSDLTIVGGKVVFATSTFIQ